MALKLNVPDLTVAQAGALNTLFVQHPDYQWTRQQMNALRAALYKALIPLVGKAQMIDVANTLLKLPRV